jgi:hypothetical protein
MIHSYRSCLFQTLSQGLQNMKSDHLRENESAQGRISCFRTGFMPFRQRIQILKFFGFLFPISWFHYEFDRNLIKIENLRCCSYLECLRAFNQHEMPESYFDDYLCHLNDLYRFFCGWGPT